MFSWHKKERTACALFLFSEKDEVAQHQDTQKDAVVAEEGEVVLFHVIHQEADDEKGSDEGYDSPNLISFKRE